MKKVFCCIIFSLLHISNIHAREFEVTNITVKNDDLEKTPEQRHYRSIMKLPTIDQDDDIFTISLLPYNSYIEVYSLDSFRLCIYYYNNYVVDGVTQINVPTHLSKEITKVVLKVNERTYIGQ